MPTLFSRSRKRGGDTAVPMACKQVEAAQQRLRAGNIGIGLGRGVRSQLPPVSPS